MTEGSSKEISFISMNSRSSNFFATLAGRSAMELYGPFVWILLRGFGVRVVVRISGSGGNIGQKVQ